MVLIERNDIIHPILSGYTCLCAKYKQRYDISKFLKKIANFFSTAAFCSSSVDPPSQESTDCGLSAKIVVNAYRLDQLRPLV